MSGTLAALATESLKARRSKVLYLAALGFMIVPFIDGLFMIIIKDPERARSLGLISAKAQIISGVADWPTFLGVLSQATAVGGILLYSLVTSWIFGREYVDRTAKDLLALPTSRWAIAAAKFAIVAVWSFALMALILGLGLVIGQSIGLPGWSRDVMNAGMLRLFVTTCLMVVLTTPIAFMASAGRGYLPPLSFAILMIVLAQILAATGWGMYFPWSIPALYSQVAGPRFGALGFVSYVIVAITSLIGIFLTFYWWKYADQTR